MDALERDFYEERRRKWRRSAFWRGFLVAAGLAMLRGAGFGGSGVELATSHVARFEVSGIIADDPDRDELLGELADNDSVKAVVLRVNSPGGTTAGSEALFASLRRIAERKPLVAQLGRGRGLGRLRGGDRGGPHRGARQHADRVDRRDHGVSEPDAGDGPAGDRARDGALVRAQGRAVAVPADQSGGTGAGGGAGGGELRLVSRPGRASGGNWAATRWTRWRTAASSPGGWRWRTG